MKKNLFGAALLAIVFAGTAMADTTAAGTKGQNPSGQTNSEKQKVPQGPAVTIPLSTGTPINASLVGTLEHGGGGAEHQPLVGRCGNRDRDRVGYLSAQRAVAKGQPDYRACGSHRRGWRRNFGAVRGI